jgi:hypothetical protein
MLLLLIVFPASAFLTEKSVILGTSSSLGWASFLGWLLIGGAGLSILVMILLLVCYSIRGDKFQVKYSEISW